MIKFDKPTTFKYFWRVKQFKIFNSHVEICSGSAADSFGTISLSMSVWFLFIFYIFVSNHIFFESWFAKFLFYFPSFCISLNVFLGTTVSNVCMLTGFSADFDEINDLGHDKMILTLQAPIPQNGQTPSNNSSATTDELLPTNCLNVFDHFVKLAFKGLTNSVRLFF